MHSDPTSGYYPATNTTKPNPADRYDPDNDLLSRPFQMVGSRPILLSLIEIPLCVVEVSLSPVTKESYLSSKDSSSGD